MTGEQDKTSKRSGWTISNFTKECATMVKEVAEKTELPDGYEYDSRRDMIVKVRPKDGRRERQERKHMIAYQKLLRR